MRRGAIGLILILVGGLMALGAEALAQKSAVDLSARKAGTVTGLPIPRFVSLKADEVNVRRGPAWDQQVAWVFRRAGLPVEITAEFDVWRQVRDSEGASGWVLGSLLSSRRTVLVAPWQDKARIIELYASASKSSAVAAKLSPGVLGDVYSCDGNWCQISTGGVSGYIGQDYVWGVYPGEKVN